MLGYIEAMADTCRLPDADSVRTRPQACRARRSSGQTHSSAVEAPDLLSQFVAASTVSVVAMSRSDKSSPPMDGEFAVGKVDLSTDEQMKHAEMVTTQRSMRAMYGGAPSSILAVGLMRCGLDVTARNERRHADDKWRWSSQECFPQIYALTGALLDEWNRALTRSVREPTTSSDCATRSGAR